MSPRSRAGLPNVLLVAADAAGAVRGFVAAHPADGEFFLLFVHPAAAGRGVGRRLLDAAHDALRDAGCREAFLCTHEQNERALAVYRDGTVRESVFRGTAMSAPRLVKPLC
jgi:ribosomal protein S18 acetylase RimI-like enzyme